MAIGPFTRVKFVMVTWMAPWDSPWATSQVISLENEVWFVSSLDVDWLKILVDFGNGSEWKPKKHIFQHRKHDEKHRKETILNDNLLMKIIHCYLSSWWFTDSGLGILFAFAWHRTTGSSTDKNRSEICPPGLTQSWPKSICSRPKRHLVNLLPTPKNGNGAIYPAQIWISLNFRTFAKIQII